MYLEIGGMPIFSNDKKGAGLNVKADRKFCYYINSGRNALYQLLKLENIEKVYISAYNCYTVIEPFINNGIQVELYDVDRYFKIIDLFEKLDNESKKCAIVIQNYYATYYLDKIKQKLKGYTNVLIIEDITQSMLDNRFFSGADYYVGSVRKWAGTGEGGIIITDKIIESLPENDNEFISLYKKMYPMQLEYITNRNMQLKLKYRGIQAEIDMLFDSKPIQRINRVSLDLISNIDYDYIKQKRRENYIYLLNKLKSLDFIELPINYINDETVPLYLPIYVKNRDEVQKFLFKYNIYMPILWPIYDKIKNRIDIETQYIYDNILCLHIDQRYDKKDMDRVYNALVDYRQQVLNK